MPMGIGPGLSVTRFESGIPGWMTGMDLGWDFTQNVQYSGATNPTDTHSATVYAQSAAGGWSPFAANTLVRTDLGLQTVPTRTNSIRNNSMSGAASGTPGTLPTNWSISSIGTLTQQIVGSGTENGIPYIDLRLSGTTSTTFIDLRFETITGVASANGVTWAGSAFLKLVAGSLSNISNLSLAGNMHDAATGYLATLVFATAIAPTSSLLRYSGAVTTNNASVASFRPQLTLTFSSGVAIDITLRIAAPQLEQGAFASAPILTTSGAATVNGNQQVVDLTGRLSAGVGGIMQVNILQPNSNVAPRLFEISDGTATNRFAILGGATGVEAIMSAGGASQGVVSDAGSVFTGLLTIAFAASSNFFTFQIVGRSALTPDTVATYPAMSSLGIMGRGYNANDNTYALTRRLALRFGAQNASTFADLFAKATILAAVS